MNSVESAEFYRDLPHLYDAQNLLGVFQVNPQGIPIADIEGRVVSRFETPLYRNLRTELSGRDLRPTLLRPAEYNELTADTNAIVLEIGGTKVRLRVIHAINANKVEYLRDEAGNEIGMELPISNKNYKNPEEFFISLIHMVSPALDVLCDKQIPIHACVTIFSFDSAAEEENGHIFLRPKEDMSKQFVVPGISQIQVGKITSELLTSYGINFVDNFAIVDLNDGPATMLDRIGAHYSKIGGTGENDCIALPDGKGGFLIWNFETGDLSSFPLSLPERSVNQDSENKGRHYSEMKVGSENIVDVTNWIISHMINKHILPYTRNEKLTGANFSEILKDRKGAFKEKFEGFKSKNQEQWSILSEIAWREWQNAVLADGMITAMLINLHPNSFPDKDVYLLVDGTKFWKTFWYKKGVQSVAESYLLPDGSGQPSHRLHFIKASGARGGGRAGLSTYHKRNII